jgi:glutathione synthase/RimK-type ligase-like ATP-grasp enzyme
VILLWGLEQDAPMAAVAAALQEAGGAFTFLSQLDVARTNVRFRLAAGEPRGAVETASGRLDLRRVGAMYARPFSADQLLGDSHDCAALRHARRVEQHLWTWAELGRATIVNRASAMAPNQSKPFQSLAIGAAGFRVPETLVTTSPAAARAFWRKHREVIYKSVSGVRSRVSRLRSEHATRLANIAWCPTQFQAFVPGREHRVHVVGDAVFCCEIVSDADDYRYAEDRVELRPAHLPPEIAERCVRLAAAQQLQVAGLDLRLTPDGAWYCFEVNPSPGFAYYEPSSGPIAAAIASLLTRADAAGSRR